jgi:hypothetical protein
LCGSDFGSTTAASLCNSLSAANDALSVCIRGRGYDFSELRTMNVAVTRDKSMRCILGEQVYFRAEKMLVDECKGSSALLSGAGGWEFDGVETLRLLSMPALQSVSTARSSSACMRVDFVGGGRVATDIANIIMCPGGSLAEIEALVHDCLVLIGEVNAPR